MLALLLGCFACATTAEPAATTATTSANVPAVTRDHALDAIVEARCAREFSCGHVGAGLPFRDYDSCARDVRLSMRDSIAASCDGGGEASSLSSCLADIRELHCDAPADTIERFGACANQDRNLCSR